MAKICNNCACYEVCFMANPCRTEDCNINWQPIIVRCKDCKHYYGGNRFTDINFCHLLPLYDAKGGLNRADDDFCSYGERKDNETD